MPRIARISWNLVH